MLLFFEKYFSIADEKKYENLSFSDQFCMCFDWLPHSVYPPWTGELDWSFEQPHGKIPQVIFFFSANKLSVYYYYFFLIIPACTLCGDCSGRVTFISWPRKTSLQHYNDSNSVLVIFISTFGFCGSFVPMIKSSGLKIPHRNADVNFVTTSSFYIIGQISHTKSRNLILRSNLAWQIMGDQWRKQPTAAWHMLEWTHMNCLLNKRLHHLSIVLEAFCVCELYKFCFNLVSLFTKTLWLFHMKMQSQWNNKVWRCFKSFLVFVFKLRQT